MENNYGNVVNKLIEHDRVHAFPEGLVGIFKNNFICEISYEHSIPNIIVKKLGKFSNILNTHIFLVFLLFLFILFAFECNEINAIWVPVLSPSSFPSTCAFKNFFVLCIVQKMSILKSHE